ncbi:MAG: hypothetical protein U0V72_01565 [Cytophagales bacterium]
MLLLLTACVSRDYTASNRAIICNESLHDLRLEYYRYGQVQENLTVEVKSKECNQVFSATGRGSTSNYFNEIKDMDSAVITFSDSFKFVHYGYQKTGSNPKSYSNSHVRNIIGDGNGLKDAWVLKILKQTKHIKSTEHQYSFREDDYFFSKK